MKKTLTFIFLISTMIACRHQSKNERYSLESEGKIKKEYRQHSKQEKEKDSISADFSAKWIADSLGQNGFRINHYNFDSSNRTWYINGMALKGYNKEEIIKLLGNPKNSGLGKEDNLLIMVYIIRQKKRTTEKNLILYFDKENNLVNIVEKEGKLFHKSK